MPFNRLNHSLLGEIRPRFALKTQSDPVVAMDQIATGISSDPRVNGVRSDQLVFLKIPENQQHYWSPEMTVRIEVEEYTDYTTVSCLIGPKQTVWALWAMIYTAILLVTAFSAVFGWVDYYVNGNTGWLWVTPIGVLGLSSAFVASKFGQKKGRDQMLHLVSFLYHELSKLGEVERIERL